MEVTEEGQLELFGELPAGLPPLAPTLPALEPVPAPPLHRARRLSFTALSLFERCSYRYYAERVAGMRERGASGGVPGVEGLARPSSEVPSTACSSGSTSPRLDVPDDLDERIRSEWPTVTEENIERIRVHVAAYCDSELAARVAGLSGAGPRAALHLPARRRAAARLPGRVPLGRIAWARRGLQDERARGARARCGRRAGLPPPATRLRARLPATGVEEAEVVYQFLERPDDPVSRVFGLAEVPALEAELSTRLAGSTRTTNTC